MNTAIDELYPNGKLRGELIYELLDSERVPFVLAQEAPTISATENVAPNLSGVFVYFFCSRPAICKNLCSHLHQ